MKKKLSLYRAIWDNRWYWVVKDGIYKTMFRAKPAAEKYMAELD